MLPDYMFEWQKQLWRKLCDTFKADISCKIVDNELRVDIVRGYDNWHYVLENMEDQIHLGLPTGAVHREIVYNFKQDMYKILEDKWFFKKEDDNEKRLY